MNQCLGLLVPVPAAGTYAVLIDPTSGPGYGTWQAQVDGRPVGQPHDAYAARLASPDSPVEMGRVTLAPGQLVLTLLVDGKDPRSTGYLAGIDFTS